MSGHEGGGRVAPNTLEWKVMKARHRKAIAAAGLGAVAVLGMSACSSEKATQATSAVSSSASSMMSSTPSSSAMVDPAADLVGAGCAGYAAKVPSGPGSVAGMSQDPVAVAASNNPELSTLTSALSGKFDNTAMPVGRVEVDMKSGAVTLNGKPIGGEQDQMVAEACRKAGIR